MHRLLLILLSMTLLLALTPRPAYAGPPPSNGEDDAFDSIAGVIGTLGLYAAMMAILAVGPRLGGAAATLLHLTPGTVLSGLSAAAGSGFWHDQLARLRSFKEAARQVEELTT